MRGAAAILAAPAAFAATAVSAQAPSDLDLYRYTFLYGMHGHPVGSEGQRLAFAESALRQRRARLRPALVQRYGEAAVSEAEQGIEDDMHAVYYLRAMTREEEWRQIRNAQRRMQALERRMRGAGE